MGRSMLRPCGSLLIEGDGGDERGRAEARPYTTRTAARPNVLVFLHLVDDAGASR